MKHYSVKDVPESITPIGLVHIVICDHGKCGCGKCGMVGTVAYFRLRDDAIAYALFRNAVAAMVGPFEMREVQ
jgi:hypothetical protein